MPINTIILITVSLAFVKPKQRMDRYAEEDGQGFEHGSSEGVKPGRGAKCEARL